MLYNFLPAQFSPRLRYMRERWVLCAVFVNLSTFFCWRTLINYSKAPGTHVAVAAYVSMVAYLDGVLETGFGLTILFSIWVTCSAAIRISFIEICMHCAHKCDNWMHGRDIPTDRPPWFWNRYPDHDQTNPMDMFFCSFNSLRRHLRRKKLLFGFY